MKAVYLPRRVRSEMIYEISMQVKLPLHLFISAMMIVDLSMILCSEIYNTLDVNACVTTTVSVYFYDDDSLSVHDNMKRNNTLDINTRETPSVSVYFCNNGSLSVYISIKRNTCNRLDISAREAAIVSVYFYDTDSLSVHDSVKRINTLDINTSATTFVEFYFCD